MVFPVRCRAEGSFARLASGPRASRPLSDARYISGVAARTHPSQLESIGSGAVGKLEGK